ncbi:MAG: ribonuclease P protein component [Oscillospiraceae bacterium]|nr:ribonuclease P protein component [Oscillospiraceae bacterium]
MKATQSLKNNRDFRYLYRKGKTAVSPYMAVYCRKNRLACNRLGLTASVKLGNAVKRNRARRRLREVYRTNEARLASGYDIILVARARTITGDYASIQRSFLRLMDKLGLLRDSEGGAL